MSKWPSPRSGYILYFQPGKIDSRAFNEYLVHRYDRCCRRARGRRVHRQVRHIRAVNTVDLLPAAEVDILPGHMRQELPIRPDLLLAVGVRDSHAACQRQARRKLHIPQVMILVRLFGVVAFVNQNLPLAAVEREIRTVRETVRPQTDDPAALIRRRVVDLQAAAYVPGQPNQRIRALCARIIYKAVSA